MKSSIFTLLLFACATMAEAQTPLSCSANVVTAAPIRPEGGAELTADYVVDCTGGATTGVENTVPAYTLTLTFNTNITSRLLAAGWSEALLLVDEPSERTQLACGTPSGVCTVTGASQSRPNVFQAQASASNPNQLIFPGFPLDPPGSGHRILRFTNLRVNAVGAAAGITASLAITGTPSVTVTNATRTVAQVQAATGLQARFVQSGLSGISQFTLTLSEKFPSALKTLSSAAFVSTDTSPVVPNQDVPGAAYPGNESGFHNNALSGNPARGSLSLAGVADNGSRLLVAVGPISSAVTISTYSGANFNSAGNNMLRLITADSIGRGAFAPMGACCGLVQLTPDTNGTVRAVFEVLGANASALESVDIPFVLASGTSGVAPLTSLTVTASLAPTSNVTTADATSSLPRFSGTATFPLSAIIVSPTSLPPTSAGTPYSVQFSATGGTAPYSWTAGSALPAGLIINGNGLMSGTPQTNGTFTFTVAVGDSAQNTANVQYGLNVGTTAPIGIGPATLPNGSVGGAYSQTLTATGGTAPYAFTVTGTLPQGLVLNAGGVLSGTPTATGTSSFTVNVSDAAKASGTKQYSLIIATALDISNASPLPGGAVGAPYSVTLTATGGTPPYAFTPSGSLPQGLTLSQGGVLSGTPVNTGTVAVAALVTDSAQNSFRKSFQVTFGSSAPLLTVSKTSLNFTALAGGDTPPPQSLSVISTAGPAVNFQVVVDNGSSGSAAAPWLVVRPVLGATPANLTINVDQTGLAAGTYNGRLRFLIAGNSSIAPVDVLVTLTVLAATQQLEVSPTVVRLKVGDEGEAQDVYLTLRNSGGAGAISFTAVTLNRSSWIVDITPSSGSTTPNSPLSVRVRVNTQGLAPGSHRDVLRITWAGGTIDVPISVFVASPGPILSIDVTAQRFESNQGGGYTIPQAVRVANTGDPGTTVNFTAEVLNGGNWLAVGDGSVVTGSVAAGQSVPVTLSGKTASAGLPLGGSYGLVRISDPAANNSPQYVVIVLDQAPSTAPVIPQFAPGALEITVSAGSGSQTASAKVYASSPAPVQFYAAAVTDDGGTWLTVTPSGTASASTPGVITVQVNAAGLAPGIHKGQIDVTMSGVVRTKDVTVIVTPASAPAASARRAAAGPAANCIPTRLAITQAGIANSFVIPAGWPATLIVQLTDDCGSAVTNASTSASFSNGDPPLSLDSDRTTGAYTGTWQPGIVTQQMSVTIRASASGLTQATAQLSGTINANAAPVLNKNGTVNAFSEVKAGALTPGTDVEVFGSGLAATSESAPSVPLPAEFRNTFMLVGPLQAPVIFVSPGQVNVQIPSELKPNQQYPVIISANGALTTPDNIDVVDVQPGVAQYRDGSGNLIAQHSVDFSLVDAGHPAKPGEILIMYLVGMGATTIPVPSGTGAPSGPFAEVTVKPTVTVDSQPADVSFAGLTPNGVGLYQINFTVPQGAATGNLQVAVSQGTATANVTTLPVQR